MKTILLSQGKFALVDDEDFEWLNQWKWYAQKSPNDKFYARRRIGKQKISMHGTILGLKIGEFGDHKNGDSLDNRRINLRKCTIQTNGFNRRKQKYMKGKKCSSRFKGVSLFKLTGRFKASIFFNYREIYLGYFASEEEAAKMYDIKAKELFGEFARLNFP